MGRRRPVDVLQDTLALVAQHGGVKPAARASGIPYGTLLHRHDAAIQWREKNHDPVVHAPPDEDIDVGELLDRRTKLFRRKAKVKDAQKLIRVDIKCAGPVGIAHLGDPHVDDDGTNLPLLREHVALLASTEGLYAGNVGDQSNNWIGRLARLYAEQGTSAREAWALVEWLVTSVPWVFIIGGNHDVWSGAGDPIKWMAAQAARQYAWHGVRLDVKFPNGRSIRVNARHDFRGHSMWNTAHGPAKAVQMGWRDHVLTCGHTHVSGYQVLKDPATGLISHALRVGSYKTYDRYADEKGLPDQNIFVCPVTIIRPQFADDDVRLITTIFSPEEAAAYLGWLRSRKSEHAA
jgi:hypothetical protein